MKYILFTFTFAASVCAAPVLFAGSGLMDDLIKPYDDSLIELPGETAHKPSVSRSAQLVDDSATDTWGARDGQSSTPEKKKASSSSNSTRSKSFTADGTYIPYSERYPEEKQKKSEPELNRNDTDGQSSKGRPTQTESRQDKISEVMGKGTPQVILDSKADELAHNPARDAALEAPATPYRWTRAPNGWFCDYNDVMEKAQKGKKAVAVFFHSSDNKNSRDFMSDRLGNSKFKNKMRDRLFVLYMDYPDNAGTSKDRRHQDQVQHNKRIAEKFHVSTYPTVIILDSAGNELGRLDNSNSITTFVEKADSIVPQRETKEKSPTGFKMGGKIEFGESGQD